MGSGTGSLLALALATVGILALAWWTSRVLAAHGVPALARGQERFRVLDQLALGRNERLALVRFQDRCLLLGVTDHSITLLRELEGDEAAAWLSEGKPAPDFAELLGGVLRKRNSRGQGVQEAFPLDSGAEEREKS